MKIEKNSPLADKCIPWISQLDHLAGCFRVGEGGRGGNKDNVGINRQTLGFLSVHKHYGCNYIQRLDMFTATANRSKAANVQTNSAF